MEDEKIIGLYWERSESAITETAAKYGRYCHAVAYHILYSHEDSEECVNDTYMRAWNSMPPGRPSLLKAFLGKITRNLAFDRYERANAQKRGAGEVPLVLEEMQECIPAQEGAKSDPERVLEDLVLAQLFDRFLETLSEDRRRIFVRRYWYLDSVKEIAQFYGMGESKVRVSLMRTRNQLRQFLEQEGVSL